MSYVDHTSFGAQQFHKLFETMLQEARAKNDGVGLGVEETNQIRGRIAVLKELLALQDRTKVLDAQAIGGHPD